MSNDVLFLHDVIKLERDGGLDITIDGILDSGEQTRLHFTKDDLLLLDLPDLSGKAEITDWLFRDIGIFEFVCYAELDGGGYLAVGYNDHFVVIKASADYIDVDFFCNFIPSNDIPLPSVEADTELEKICYGGDRDAVSFI